MELTFKNLSAKEQTECLKKEIQSIFILLKERSKDSNTSIN